MTPSGPLTGLRVVEIASIGPGPHCAMLLADLGAEVLRIERPGGNGWPNPIMDRGRSTVSVDLRMEAGREFCRAVTDRADVLIEGFRPGVMEKLELGPTLLRVRNPRLIYGRMTGWGQTGPFARIAGHDIDYVAMTGALAAIGRPGEPAMPPLNLVGDFGGGSMLLAFGIVAALVERTRSGLGQVVDAAIVDGVSSMMAMFSGLPSSMLSLDRDRSLLGGAAPFYRCYRCADGLEIAVGALEPQFYALFVSTLGLAADIGDRQMDQSLWPERAQRLEALFLTRPRDDWASLFAGSDACVVPVLTLTEAPLHPALADRATYRDVDGQLQPGPVPRFDRTPGSIRSARDDGRRLAEAWGAFAV